MKKIIAISTFILTTILIGCKKYEEDKGLQLRTVKNRLKGDWSLDHYFVNEVEKNSSFVSFNFNIAKDLTINGISVYTNNGYGDDYIGIFENTSVYSPEYGIQGAEGLIAGKEKNLFFIGLNTQSTLFEIVSLTKDKLVLEIYGGSAERFEFKKDN